MACKVESTCFNGEVSEIVQETNYPLDGAITFTIKSSGIKKMAFRIPNWCESYSFKLNGNEVAVKIKNGYAYISRLAEETDVIHINYQMNCQLIETSPEAQENSGRVALQRGPILYCLEAIDNGHLLRDIRIHGSGQYEVIKDAYFGAPIIKTMGYHRNPEHFKNQLYKPLTEKLEKINLTFIPYYGFANRGESEMVVWVLGKS